MDSLATTNLTECYLTKKNMDTQIGALSAKTPVNRGLRHLDPETDYKVRRITSFVNESIHIVATEPSLGLYRIQQHVQRTVPHLIERKKDMKANNHKIEGALYDLSLSLEVIKNMGEIKHFTRIQEALNTALEMKRRLNIQAEDLKSQLEQEAKQAQLANKSLSQNAPAEGYICPVCYYALSNQDELIFHWQREHSLEDCENDVFQELEPPPEENYIVKNDNDMTVIDFRQPRISECEDVVSNISETTNQVPSITERFSHLAIKNPNTYSATVGEKIVAISNEENASDGSE